jgi:hypothetical protein
VISHFHAIDPQGQVHRRSSKTRTYSHAVVVKIGRAYREAVLAKHKWTVWNADEVETYVCMGWTSRRDLAAKMTPLNKWVHADMRHLVEDVVILDAIAGKVPA